MMRMRSGVGGSLGGMRALAWLWMALFAMLAACAGGDAPAETTGDAVDASGPPPFVGSDGAVPDPGGDAGPDATPVTPDATPPDEAPSPKLTAITPNKAVVGTTGPTLVVTGSGFVARSLVQLNGVALVTSFVSDTELRATVPNASLVMVQTLHVSVGTAPPGGGASADLPFDVVYPAPSITSLAPSSVPVGAPDTALTVTGASFAPGATITFDGLALATTVKSETSATATIPRARLATSGSFNVTVQNPLPGGGASSPIAFTVTNPTVAITSVTPDTAAIGAQALPVTLVGSGFVAASAVSFNGVVVPSTVSDAKNAKATLPSSAFTTAGNFPVVVTNPAPGGGVSTPYTFHVVYPVPTATSLSPSSVVAGSAPPTVTVTGAGFFSSRTQIAFNGAPAVSTVIDATHISATLTTAQVALASTLAVTVVNPAPGGGSSTPPLTFTVANPVPTAATLSPASVDEGSPSTTVTVGGTGFVAGASVLANGAAVATTFVNATTLSAVLPAALLTTARTFPVAVTNPAPGGGSSASLTFTVTNPGPTITSLAPSSVLIPAGTTTLTVTGTGFVSASVVQSNGAALATTYVSPTSLTAVLPAAQLTAAATLSITVSNPAPGGGTSAAAFFTVNDPVPTLTAVSPNALAFGGPSTTITLTGTNFVDGSIVKSNGATLASTTQSATSITATVPAAQLTAVTTLTITVTNPPPGGGTSAGLPITVACSTTGVDYAFTALGQTTTVSLNLLASGVTRASRIMLSSTGAPTETCPATADTSASEPFLAYVVQNTLGTSATLSAWAACTSTASRQDDGFIAIYDRATVPTTQAQFEACSGVVSEGASGAGGFDSYEPGGSSYCPGLTKSNGGGFTIPACGKAIVMVQAWSITSSVYTPPTTLKMKLE